MCLRFPINSSYNEQCAAVGREDGLIDVVVLDFSTEGWREFGDEEWVPWRNPRWFEVWLQGMLWGAWGVFPLGSSIGKQSDIYSASEVGLRLLMALNTKLICWEHKRARDFIALKCWKRKEKVLSKEQLTDFQTVIIEVLKYCFQMKVHQSQNF